MPRRKAQRMSGEAVRAAARACGFPLVGLARAEPLDPAPLKRWLDAGYAADMSWMARDALPRADPSLVLPGARTVVALGIPYAQPEKSRSPVARYARGRDYHYAHRDRMRALRKRLLRLDPTLETYAAVDTGLAMEKPWAERAGLGWIGKNGCLISETWGSWLTLSVMFLDRDVDHHDRPHPNLCGECTLCLRACPTKAFPSPGVVDARRCIAYQTIENHGPIPIRLRPRLGRHVFGCDVCQDVCPFNRPPEPTDAPRDGDARFAARAIGRMNVEELAALTPDQWSHLAPGTALVRAGYDGVRRNAALALGAARRRSARPLLERLAGDASTLVSEAARWALGRLGMQRGP